MSHPNEAMLRHAYEAFAVGDLDPVLGMLSDDISWHASRDSPVAGDYSGREGVLRFFAAMMTQYGGTLRLQVNDVLASDDHGVVLTTESGTAGGERIEWASVHVFTIRDGKCVRFVSYEDDAYHQFWAARRVAGPPLPARPYRPAEPPANGASVPTAVSSAGSAVGSGYVQVG